MKFLQILCLIVLATNVFGQLTITLTDGIDCTGQDVASAQDLVINSHAGTTFDELATCVGLIANKGLATGLTLDLSTATALGDPTNLDLTALDAAVAIDIDISESALTADNLNAAIAKFKAFADAVIGTSSNITTFALTINADTPTIVNLSNAATVTALKEITDLTAVTTSTSIVFNPVITSSCTLAKAASQGDYDACYVATIDLVNCSADDTTMTLATELTLGAATGETASTAINTCLGFYDNITSLTTDISGFTGQFTADTLELPSTLNTLDLNISGSGIDQDELDILVAQFTTANLDSLTLTLSVANDNSTFDNLTGVLTLAQSIAAADFTIAGCSSNLTDQSTALTDCLTNFPVSFNLESDATNDTVGACDNTTITVSIPSTPVWKNVVAGSEPAFTSATYSWVVTPSGGSAEDAVTTATLPYAITSTTDQIDYEVVLTATISSVPYTSETYTFTVGTCEPTFTITQSPTGDVEICESVTFTAGSLINAASATASSHLWTVTKSDGTDGLPASHGITLTDATLTIPADKMTAAIADLDVKCVMTLSDSKTPEYTLEGVNWVACTNTGGGSTGGDDDDDDDDDDSSNVLAISLVLALLALLF